MAVHVLRLVSTAELRGRAYNCQRIVSTCLSWWTRKMQGHNLAFWRTYIKSHAKVSRLPSHFHKSCEIKSGTETLRLCDIINWATCTVASQVHWSTCSTCSATRRTRLSGRRQLHCLQRWSLTNWLDLKWELCSPSFFLLSSWTPWETVLRPAYTCLKVSLSCYLFQLYE